MRTLCDCGQYHIYPGSDECRVCDGSYRLTYEERDDAIDHLPQFQAVTLAIMCAEEVLPLWEGNDAPDKAIQAAKNWLKNPSEENHIAAKTAGGIADSSAVAAANANIAYANVAYVAAAAAYAAATYGVYFGYSASSAAELGADLDNNIYEKVDRWLYVLNYESMGMVR